MPGCGELVQDTEVAEEIIHAVCDGVVDSRDQVLGVALAAAGVGFITGQDGALREKGSQIAAAADLGEEKKFLQVRLQGEAPLLEKLFLQFHDDASSRKFQVPDRGVAHA